jgi:hypothetical protein
VNLPSRSLPLPKAFYDKNSGGYWFQDTKGWWLRFQQNDFARYLKDWGYSGRPAEGEVLSALDRAIMAIQQDQNVDYAGPLAGYAQGLIEMEGKSILVTDSPKLIEPAHGDWGVLQQMLLNMFGEEQLRFFQAWIKLSFESLVSGDLRPGQALVLAGPRNSGKSLVQKIITEVLGGRAAHPYRHMRGGTEFNSELFGAEHLIIDDQCGSSDFKSRQKLTAQFKTITAAGSQQCHPKGRAALTLTPFWRLSVSVNDDPESLLVLPLIREDLEDKILLFQIEHREMPMPTKTNEERRLFWNRLLAELPHWLHHVTHWEIPAEIAADRFGMTHYHHPDIVNAIDSLSPQAKFFNLLRSQFSGAFHPALPWTCTAAEVEDLLTGPIGHSSREARNLLHWPTACGTYLSDAAKKHPENVRRANRQDNLHQWVLDFAPCVDVGVRVDPTPDLALRLPPPPTIDEPGKEDLPIEALAS